MSSAAPLAQALEPTGQPEQPPPSVWRTVLMTGEGRAGVLIGLALIALIVIGPAVAPYDPTDVATGSPLEGPSADHLLGTDQLGRDVLSRFLYGGSTVLLIPLAAVALSFLLGGALGLFAAYRHGTVDILLTRTFDLLIALPALLIVLVLIAGLGTSWVVIILVIAGVFGPRVARILRGAAQAVVTQDYIAAAEARGESTVHILLHELLPNMAAAIIVNFSLFLTYGIIFVSTLSFLGLGAQPPNSDWGLMVAESRVFINVNPWATLMPAFGIAALAIAFTLVGDAVTRHFTREAEEGAVAL